MVGASLATRPVPLGTLAGETGTLKLDNPKNNYERNATDVFNITSEDVGPLRRLKV